MNIQSVLRSHLNIVDNSQSSTSTAPATQPDAGNFVRVDRVEISHEGKELSEKDGDSDDNGSNAATSTDSAGTTAKHDKFLARLGESIKSDNPDLFNAIDANHDGSLSSSELRSARKAFRDAVKTAVREVNADGTASADGAGSQKFVDAVSNALKNKSPDLFRALDKDGDGKLSASELRAGFSDTLPHGAKGHHGHHHMPPPATGSSDGTATPVLTTSTDTTPVSTSSPTVADATRVG